MTGKSRGTEQGRDAGLAAAHLELAVGGHGDPDTRDCLVPMHVHVAGREVAWLH